MNSHSAEISLLAPPLILLAAAVISVPLARFARLSAIVAYLIAGVVIGPSGLRLFSTPESVLPVAELGIVMLLFVIGLELELSRLLAMRRDIFGLGVAQLVITAAAIPSRTSHFVRPQEPMPVCSVRRSWSVLTSTTSFLGV